MMDIEEITERLKERVEKIKKVFLQDGSDLKENTISRQVVEPVLRDLGWPTDDNSAVEYEYPLGPTRADIALLHEEKVRVVVEVKRPGSAEGAEEQLFTYAYHAGVSLAVLTTGQEWEFYLPLKTGDYQDRQVYKLDISARETEESVSRLMRYLFYPDVCSGKAVKMAEEDHGDKDRYKKIQDALPKAWNKILSECGDSLIELLQDKVGDICGLRADSDDVQVFIKKQSENTLVPHQPKRSIPSNFVKKPVSKSSSPKKLKLKGFELHGKQSNAGNAIDTLVAVFEALIKLDNFFPDKFMQIHHGRSRRWLANERRSLYPNQNESFCLTHSRQLSTGHWIPRNNNIVEKEKMIKAACEVAKIQYGKDLKLLKV